MNLISSIGVVIHNEGVCMYDTAEEGKNYFRIVIGS